MIQLKSPFVFHYISIRENLGQNISRKVGLTRCGVYRGGKLPDRVGIREARRLTPFHHPRGQRVINTTELGNVSNKFKFSTFVLNSHFQLEKSKKTFAHV